MKLLPIAETDAALYEAMFCDAEYMKDLGGPQSVENSIVTLHKQLKFVESGKGWVFKIVLDDEDVNSTITSGTSVGTVCLWEGFFEEAVVTELGYGILCKYQGNGYATKALHLLLEKAKLSGKWGTIHSFTSITNTASNKLLSKVGFELVGQCDVEYQGTMHANHWKF
jgi:RimJ/RimL family protein N-acetyltransferase